MPYWVAAPTEGILCVAARRPLPGDATPVAGFRPWGFLCFCLVVLFWPSAESARANTLSPSEWQAVLSFGPWPPAPQRDPGNRASGQPLAMELGRRLFHDARLSPVGYIACVTCHQPDRAFTDLKARAHGLADLPRNTPSVVNLAGQPWYGWDGASDSLWLASIRPLLDARELDSNPATVARLFARDPELAAYQETLVTGRTAFDDFRDALLTSGSAGSGRYPVAALRGLKLFVGEAACVACHSGPRFTDHRFHAVAAPPGNGLLAADSGRLDGATKLRTDPLNLLGVYNDDPTRRNADATRQLKVDGALRGQFRTPGLRNITNTAPYLHDGRMDHLHDAVRHPLPAAFVTAAVAASLTGDQADDIVAFLRTLTAPQPSAGAVRLVTVVRCP